MKGNIMAYRNINVNGTTYKFIIGKTFTKVNGVGSIAHTMLGKKVYGMDEYVVEPCDVRRFILAGGTVDPHFHDGPHKCINADRRECEGEVRLQADPFEAEINEKDWKKLSFSYSPDERNLWLKPSLFSAIFLMTWITLDKGIVMLFPIKKAMTLPIVLPESE